MASVVDGVWILMEFIFHQWYHPAFARVCHFFAAVVVHNPARKNFFGGAMAVDYFENPLLPGRKMFRCERLSASLQVSACAGMWTEANAAGAVPERLFRCRQCPLGAQHAGVGDANMSALRGTPICSRCHRTDLRLIGGNVCVSCTNRQYEWIKGRNAKGKAPVKHPDLVRRTVRYVAGGEVKVLSRPLTASTDELVVELLRDSPKRVVIARAWGGGRVMRQGVLL